MARTKPSLFYKLSVCALALALTLWLAIETLPRWSSAYYLTIISSVIIKDNAVSTGTSDDVFNESFKSATAKTGVEAFIRPWGNHIGEVMLIVPASTRKEGVDRTDALFAVMAGDFENRGKPELKRDYPTDPKAVPPFFLQPWLDKASSLAMSLAIAGLALLAVGYYQATGTRPPELRSDGGREAPRHTPASNSEQEFNY